MDLTNSTRRSKARSILTLVFAGLAVSLGGCSATSMGGLVKGRSIDNSLAASQQLGEVDLLVANGTYRQIGTSWGLRAGPEISEMVAASETAAAARFADDPYGRTIAQSGAFSNALAAQMTDTTGAASEVKAIVAAMEGDQAKAWMTLEMGFQPEVGASGFGFSNGAQAYLAKAIGSPLAPHLTHEQRQSTGGHQIRIYHPPNAISFMIASWPLAGHPVAGINKRGLAMTVTSTAGGSPSAHNGMPFTYRQVLQSATSVDQAVRKLYNAKARDTGAVVLLADRFGALAHLECGIERCIEVALSRGEPLTVAHAAHVTRAVGTSENYQVDAESAARLANLENALDQTNGRLMDAGDALEVLRHTGPTNAIHGDVVANSRVSAGVVLDPYNQTLWHSTGNAPTAAHSEFVEVGFDGPTGATFAADGVNPRLFDAYDQLALAQQAFWAADFTRALQHLDAMPVVAAVDRSRLAYFRALLHAGLGEHQRAADLATGASSQSGQSNLRAHAYLLRAWNLKRLGREEQVTRMWELVDGLVPTGLLDQSLVHRARNRDLPYEIVTFPTLLEL